METKWKHIKEGIHIKEEKQDHTIKFKNLIIIKNTSKSQDQEK